MGSRSAHVAFLSFSLTIVLVLLLVTATVLEAPTASPRYPKQHLLRRAKHYQQPVVKVTVVGEQQHHEKERRQVSSMAAAWTAGKTWPHLVGLDAEEAKKKIVEQHPNLRVQIVPTGAVVSADYDLGRVRIFKDADHKVTTPPKLG